MRTNGRASFPSLRHFFRIAVVASALAACSSPLVVPPPSSPDATGGPATPETTRPSIGSPAPSTATIVPGPTSTPAPNAGARAIPRPAWRIVGELVNEAGAGQMWVATNQRQYRTRWRELTGSRARPGFDSDRQVAAFYHVLVPCDCPELGMLSIERDDQLTYGVFAPPADQAARDCSDIAGSHSFVVLIDRASLPVGPVDFRVTREFQLCDTCGRENEEVKAGL